MLLTLPTTVEGFVSLIFWHSLVFTATTPISRWFSGRWRGEASLFLLAEKLLPTWMCDHLACNDISLDFLKEGEMYNGAPVQKIDRGFGLHAAFSLLWLVTAYLTIVHSRSWGKHKQFGRLALVAFTLHVFGAVQNLSANVVRHQPISQLVLLRALMTSIDLMSSSMSHVLKQEKNWLKKHQDDMVLCYLISIQGAGPIRAVSHIQGILGFGSVQCQALHSGMATSCSLEYVMRMLLTYWWTLGTQGLYVRLRNDTELTKEYKNNVRCQFWITVGVVDLVQTMRQLHARHFPAPVETKTVLASKRPSCARTLLEHPAMRLPRAKKDRVG